LLLVVIVGEGFRGVNGGPSAGAGPGSGARLLPRRPVVVLGGWSFVFYLIHATIMYTAFTVIGEQPARWFHLGWFVALLLRATAAAGALHVWIERPVESRLRVWEQHRRFDLRV
jgi:peptidoglycan/LPS O-acetylase OafA/YrhL